VAGPGVSITAGAAAIFAAFGSLAWYVERRKGRHQGLVLLTGLPGVYLAGMASMGDPEWLYVPGITLIVVSYLMQLLSWRRDRAGRNESGSP
jgi:hypothetical protein